MSATPTSDLTCPSEDEVLAYVQGELSVEGCRRVEGHVEVCSMCRALMSELAGDVPSAPGALVPGARVAARYLLKQELGRGASATVFRATDEKLDVDVALKTFVLPSAEHRALAKRELLVARKISHPNVCRVHDVVDVGDVLCLSMELVVGETLAARIAAYGDQPIEHEFVREWLDAVLAGLAAAHERGIIHRDMKPTNVLVERATGRVVLMDFGLAKDVETLESRQRLLGTPAYWAPEQARGEEATKASDVYAVGVLAYRMLTGRSYRVSDKDGLSLVPQPFRGVVSRALASAPSDRYADAQAFRVALRRSASRRRTVWFAATTVVVLGIAAAVYGARVSNERAAESADASAETVPEGGLGTPRDAVTALLVPTPSAPASPQAPPAPTSTPASSANGAEHAARSGPLPRPPPASSGSPPPRGSGANAPELLYGR